jgi:hypothetical protein
MEVALSADPHPQPKHHHYVHRAYLEGFIDPAGDYLWAYLPMKSPFRQKPERIAKRNYYYCFDKENRRLFDFEHTLQELEDISLVILRKLRSRDFALSPEDRLAFAGYVALSYTRVPTFERNINRVTSLHAALRMEEFLAVPENLALAARRYSKSTGKQVTPEELKKNLNAGNVILNQTSRGWSLKQIIDVMMLLQRVIYDMRWVFLVAENEDEGFITSDNPVALFGAPTTDVPGVGFLSSPATYFTFPVSRTICLLAKHLSGKAQTVRRISSVGVRQVNKGAIARADTQLYAPFKSGKIQLLHDAAVMSRGNPKRVMVKKGRIVEE